MSTIPRENVTRGDPLCQENRGYITGIVFKKTIKVTEFYISAAAGQRDGQINRERNDGKNFATKTLRHKKRI